MTLNDCVAVPEPTASVTVTVTVVSPAASGVTVSVEPEGPRAPAEPPPVVAISTVATAGAEDDAAYVNGSPSGSRNAPDTSTVAAPSGW